VDLPDLDKKVTVQGVILDEHGNRITKLETFIPFLATKQSIEAMTSEMRDIKWIFAATIITIVGHILAPYFVK